MKMQHYFVSLYGKSQTVLISTCLDDELAAAEDDAELSQYVRI
jgi:hypothetical protein